VVKPIPIIDLFAGPGGLSEGFTSVRAKTGARAFRIALSIEREEAAHTTLRLRAFFRQFSPGKVPKAYYQYLRGEITRDALYRAHPTAACAAKQEAWLAELGVEPHDNVKQRICEALDGASVWALIGGPPCQAYSLVGRARRTHVPREEFEADKRHRLYKEYLRILADHRPPVFVMENVKGLLSSTLKGERIFERILEDLAAPSDAVGNADGLRYRLFPFNAAGQTQLWSDAKDFIIRSEEHGIPQARHRIIVLGVREDLLTTDAPAMKLDRIGTVSVAAVIDDLPRLRSGLSKGVDSGVAWRNAIRSAVERWSSHPQFRTAEMARVLRHAEGIVKRLRVPRSGRGAPFRRVESAPAYKPDWYTDVHLEGVCNHETRGHITSDLERYLFASCFAVLHGRSPTLKDFPDFLLPDHRNARNALNGNLFSDRFRVQVKSRPSTTITSHISKDGHYFIHYDPSQCRSLTVREAARLQTFPDNYLFEGSRTEQYVQVGNAVPPILAHQIAGVVLDVLRPLTGESPEPTRRPSSHKPTSGHTKLLERALIAKGFAVPTDLHREI